MAPTNGPSELPDGELLHRSRAGDAEAFAVIYRRCQGRIYRFALHMSGSRAVAEDVTQEVFMTLIEDGCSFDSSRGTLSAYLFGVARNHVLRRLEKERGYVALFEEETHPGPSHRKNGSNHASLIVLPPDPVRDEKIGRVRQAVLSLPANYREAVVLCDLQEMSYQEAAGVLKCAVGTVRSRLHRGRALLTEKLRDTRGPEKRLATGDPTSS